MRYSSGLPKTKPSHYSSIAIDHPYAIELSKTSIYSTLSLIEQSCEINVNENIIINIIYSLLGIFRLLLVTFIDPLSVGIEPKDTIEIMDIIIKLKSKYIKYEKEFNELYVFFNEIKEPHNIGNGIDILNGDTCELQINWSLPTITDNMRNKLMRATLLFQMKCKELNLNYKIFPFWNNLTYIVVKCQDELQKTLAENFVNIFYHITECYFKVETIQNWKRLERFPYEGVFFKYI